MSLWVAVFPMLGKDHSYPSHRSVCQAPGRTLVVSELSAQELTAVPSKVSLMLCKRGRRQFSDYLYIKAVWSRDINKHSLVE